MIRIVICYYFQIGRSIILLFGSEFKDVYFVDHENEVNLR